MKKESLKIKINLTPAKKESLTNAAYKWMINVGKIIIITTQIIAMSALAYRFMLDRQINDLHDEIKWKENLIIKQGEKEQKYRNIQKRIDDIKIIDDETRFKIETLNLIVDEIKNNKYLITTRLSFEKNKFTFEAETFSVLEISRFIDNLKKINNVNSIIANNVQKEDASINFTLNIIIEEKPSLNKDVSTNNNNQ